MSSMIGRSPAPDFLFCLPFLLPILFYTVFLCVGLYVLAKERLFGCHTDEQSDEERDRRHSKHIDDKVESMLILAGLMLDE